MMFRVIFNQGYDGYDLIYQADSEEALRQTLEGEEDVTIIKLAPYNLGNGVVMFETGGVV